MGLCPVILAGGSGTRLWPLSREYFPKQFLSIMGEGSMFQESLRRLDGIAEASPPVVVCNEAHRFLVAEHARQMDVELQSIILEPDGRNTAPALTLASLAVRQPSGASNRDPTMLVMPSDHVIKDATAFRSAVEYGLTFAEEGYLVTFGVVPTSPETGYGYIEKGEPQSGGCFRVAGFVEKPDGEAAARMIESGAFLWNSGIFMMRTSVWLEQIRLHRPEIAEACQAAYAGGRWDGDFYRPDRDLFLGCRSDSIDYAVMERATASPEADLGCAVVPLDVGWSDVGAWSALLEVSERDADGNVVQGDVRARSMSGSLMIGQHRLLAAVGLEDVIVVETADAVLVAHRDKMQEVKELVTQLKEEGRQEQRDNRKVLRPWGSYETVDAGPGFQVKRLTVNVGESLSLQLHHSRAEHWVVVAGTAKVTREEEELLLTKNQSISVPVGARHRLENAGDVPLEVVEVQSGSYLGEDDIVRLEDRYGRQEG